MERKFLAYFAASGYALLIGLSFLFSKMALEVSSPLVVLAWRFFVSFIAICIPVFLGKITIQLNAKKTLHLLPLVLFYPLLFFSFQTFGLMSASSSEAGILQAMAPIFVMVLAFIFLKESINVMQIISIVFSVFGVFYILLKKGVKIDLENFKGNILLICSVLSFAIYNVFTRKLIQEYSNWEISFTMLAVGFIVFFGFTLGQHIKQGSVGYFLLPLKNITFLSSILYLGILSTLGTSMLNNYALSKLEASRVSVFANLGTVISMIAGVIFLHEKLYYYHIIGSIFIISGVIGVNYFRK